MKTFKRTLILLSFFVLFFALTACSDSYTEQEMGTFIINFGGDTARAAYPPNIPPGNNTDPNAPTIEALRITVIFTSVGGSQLAPFIFEGNGQHRGSIPVGSYNVTVDVHLLADNSLYAQGFAELNPVTIIGGTVNPIKIQLFFPGVLLSITGDPGVYQFENLKLALDSINTSIAAEYLIRIGPNQELAPYILDFPAGTEITLEALHAPITVQLTANGNLFRIEEDVSLTLGSGVTLRGLSDNTSSLINVAENDAVFIMEDGSRITGNSASAASNAGGVLVASGGIFEMHGGHITGNNSTAAGLGAGGGGVYILSGGVFTMHDGHITENTAAGEGGGVYTQNVVFNMHNGSISNNKTNSAGGGLFISSSSATFTMYGGVISNNEARLSSGGVESGGTFNMEGGEISGNIVRNLVSNTGEEHGGGVNSRGPFNMKSGAKITGNTATGFGGGVYSGNIFTMEAGAIISGNSAGRGGGGVSAMASTFTMLGGEISGNESNLGGGVHVSYDGDFIMNGGEISGNLAKSGGGGLYLDEIDGFTMTTFRKNPGGIIYGNNAVDLEKRNVVGSFSDPLPNLVDAVWVVTSTPLRRDRTVVDTEVLEWDGTDTDGDWTP